MKRLRKYSEESVAISQVDYLEMGDILNFGETQMTFGSVDN